MKIPMYRYLSTIYTLAISVGYTLTYFSLDSVFPLVVLSIGCSHGFGFVFCYAVRCGM